MKVKKPVIGIIGLGSVGSILAAHLANHGENIIVEDIAKKLLMIIKEKGLHISGMTEISAKIDRVAGSISEFSKFDPEIVFIATKASVLKSILPEIRQICKPEMKLISFQNGLGNEQLIAETLGVETVYRMVINYAGNVTSLGQVKMNWFQPPNFIGAFQKGRYTTDKTTKYITELLTACGLATLETSYIKKHVWKKTILNSALCSICGITGQTMKEAMENENTSDLALKILEEGLKVAKADGYEFGQNALNSFAEYLGKGGAHKPSMLIDVENKRPTEVDFMSGAISSYGRVHNIPTPVNSTVTALLKALESRYLSKK